MSIYNINFAEINHNKNAEYRDYKLIKSQIMSI